MDTGPLILPYFILMTVATLAIIAQTPQWVRRSRNSNANDPLFRKANQEYAGQQLNFWSSAGPKYYSQTR
jgi:hypothetical protein